MILNLKIGVTAISVKQIMSLVNLYNVALECQIALLELKIIVHI